MNKIVTDALNQWFKDHPIDKDINHKINQANNDLYNGPCDGEEGYEGFSPTVRKISDALSDIGDLYCDDSGYAFENEPQGEEIDGEWYEPAEYYHIDRRDVLKHIVGKELVSYL